MPKPTDIRPVGAALFFLPVQTRVPLKFGPETLTHVTCARVRLTVRNADGNTAEGWGETPLSVQWVWPGALSYEFRHEALKRFTTQLAEAWAQFDATGHAFEIGHDFIEQMLPTLLAQFNATLGEGGDTDAQMPWLAALVCCSAFDIALHDAYGKLNDHPIYDTYNSEFMSRDLAAYLSPAERAALSFEGKFPADYLSPSPPSDLPAWHLVGGLDLLDDADRSGDEPDDGYPVTLVEWIKRDGIKCLKVKLRGDDQAWDYARLCNVGEIAVALGCHWLSADFNCTVTDPQYVNDTLDLLRDAHPRLYGMILYVEQPFPYELERHLIDVHSVSARKPLFMDESAHDWKLVRLGRSLGWNGVALKTCKTQTGALLSACWAKAHGMTLMVQDLTNPMLAMIPHALLAAHVGTIMGVETNAPQFYPEASKPEATVHPHLYQRREGRIGLATIGGRGFGYRLDEIERELPSPVLESA